MIEPGNDIPDGRPSRYARPATPTGTPESRPTAPELPPASTHRAGGALRPDGRAPSGTRRPALATVFLLAGPPAALAVVATIALVAALMRLEGMRNLAVNSWLLAMGGLVMWTCWRALTLALPTAASSAFDSVRHHPAEPRSRLHAVIAIEAVIIDAEWSWRAVEYRLRPLLRKMAAARLMERRHVDLESEPDAARRILGDELWALVGPGAYGPVGAEPAHVMPNPTTHADAEIAAGPVMERAQTPHGRGIPRATIRRAIEVLEEL